MHQLHLCFIECDPRVHILQVPCTWRLRPDTLVPSRPLNALGAGSAALSTVQVQGLSRTNHDRSSTTALWLRPALGLTGSCLEIGLTHRRVWHSTISSLVRESEDEERNVCESSCASATGAAAPSQHLTATLYLHLVDCERHNAPIYIGTREPSKPVNGGGDWSAAVSKAKAFIAQLAIPEKVNLTMGVDNDGRCVGDTGSVPASASQDSVSKCVPSIRLIKRVAERLDASLVLQRGQAMGAEVRGKGVNVALGSMMNVAYNGAGDATGRARAQIRSRRTSPGCNRRASLHAQSTSL
ncbi:hypothetical protein HWV62_14964 [Athelia sp. TMB]|nr:hypothetical protein HWV62_14964 [Athelia sp. TMB]